MKTFFHIVVFLLCVLAVTMMLPFAILVMKFLFAAALVVSGAFALYLIVMFVIGVISG